MSTAPTIDPQLLRRLTAGRWLIPILARIHDRPGARFGALVRQLGVSRSVLSASLDTIEREGWIIRNPGHGHPLRPDYLLTAPGRDAAAWSAVADQALLESGVTVASLTRWSLPLLAALNRENMRFGELAEALSPISPRALSMALDQLAARELADRMREPSRHPRYRRTEAGTAIARRLSLAVTGR